MVSSGQVDIEDDTRWKSRRYFCGPKQTTFARIGNSWSELEGCTPTGMEQRPQTAEKQDAEFLESRASPPGLRAGHIH
jgi:hypothetical protein